MTEEEQGGAGLQDWEDYLAILQRRRWWLGLPIFVVWVAVWGVSWFLPKTYRSETVILIEAQKVPEQYVVSNIAADIQERLQSMQQQILSRTRLLTVVEESNLYPKLRNKATPDDVVERMRNDISIELVQAPTRRGDVTAFKIYYTAPTPELAQRVTGELTRLFIDENLRGRQQQSENTTEFLQAQLEEARTKLNEQDAHLQQFKSRYMGELPAQLQPNLQILGGLQSQLQGEMQGLNRAREQNLYYKSLLGQYRSIQSQIRKGNGTTELPPALDQELTRLKTQLNELRSRYTDKHPDVRKVQEQIASTEAMKSKLESDVANVSTNPNDTPINDVRDLRAASPMMEIGSQLKANELDIENRQKQIKRLTDEIGQYQGKINQIPVREQQMAELTRDYDQSRANYESLLAKKNQSELATNLEKRQQGEQFRMLDPPSLPEKPYSPNRLKLSLMGLGAGLALGIVLAGVLELSDKHVKTEQEVKALVPPCIFTTIPRLMTPDEIRQRRKYHWKEAITAAFMVSVMAIGMLITLKKG